MTETTSTARARLILLAYVAASLFFVAITFSPLKSGFADAPSRGPSDISLYQAEIDRMQAGETYYAAAAEELRSRGYPTKSIFNWRTPLPMWLIAKLPAKWLSQATLGIAALAVMLLAMGLLTKESGPQAGLLAVLLLIGAFLPILIENLFVMTEFWSGLMLALSALAYGTERRKLGACAGIAALFFRELALPYCILCMAFSIRERHKKELLLWCGGLAAYALFYAFHLSQILPLMQSTDIAQKHSWIQFGGAGFVIATSQMNIWLLLLPQWVTALFLAAALLGLATWKTPAGERIALTVAMYLALFSIVGQPINQYWGSMIAPLLCLGAARFPTTLLTLLRLARQLSFRGPAAVNGVSTF